MSTWLGFRRFCLYGLVGSLLIAFVFWLARTKHSELSQTYYRDVVLPALAEAKEAIASEKGAVPDIGPVLQQHIDHQRKIAESSWRLSLSVISAHVFVFGLMVYRIRFEVVMRRKEKALAEETKS